MAPTTQCLIHTEHNRVRVLVLCHFDSVQHLTAQGRTGNNSEDGAAAQYQMHVSLVDVRGPPVGGKGGGGGLGINPKSTAKAGCRDRMAASKI